MSVHYFGTYHSVRYRCVSFRYNKQHKFEPFTEPPTVGEKRIQQNTIYGAKTTLITGGVGGTWPEGTLSYHQNLTSQLT